jgi:hypothetical protein
MVGMKVEQRLSKSTAPAIIHLHPTFSLLELLFGNKGLRMNLTLHESPSGNKFIEGRFVPTTSFFVSEATL